MKSLLHAAAAAATTLVAASAAAQTEGGFSLDRFDPSERGSSWFTVESLDLRGNGRPAVGLVLDWGYRPLGLYDEDGELLVAIVEHQVFAHLGASYVLWDRVRFGVNLPLAAYLETSEGAVGNQSFDSTDSQTVGDARVGGDVRLFGAHGGLVTGAAGLQLYLPTGSRAAFTGDGKVRVHPRLMIAGRAGQLEYGAKLGFAYRAQSGELDGAAFGSEATWSAAAGVRLWEDRLLVGPELYGSTSVEDADALFGRRTSPVELIVGGHADVAKDWRAGVGVGPGLTRGLGTPTVRVLASVEWTPSVEEAKAPPPPPPPGPKDRDGDGIFDADDACPDVAGEANEDKAKHGCPPPGDQDGDGVKDDADACVDVPGERTEDAKTNGCPPPDTDRDTILDRDDACPSEPGVASEDKTKHGCPLPKDSDGDEIPDPEDACPTVPGPRNDDKTKHGCPAARVEKGQIRILEQVQFATASDRILPASDPVLQAVLKVLQDNPGITKLSIEGHTDNRGAAPYNRNLSQRRARSVMKWLTKHGIDPKRLTSAGFGPDRPLDTNDTDEGRQRNRRVEFHIREENGKPVEAAKE